MDQIPSRSISKSVLLATPLFIIILSVLHASGQLSYLFVLDFVNNVAGTADLMFIPTLQPQVSEDTFNSQILKEQYGIYGADESSLQDVNIPLVNISELEEWRDAHDLVRGISPRWLIPMVTQNTTDTLLMVMNISHEGQIGIGQASRLPTLTDNEVIVEATLLHQLNMKPGDVLPVSLKIQKMLSGLKLIERFQETSSQEENIIDSEDIKPEELADQLYDSLDLESRDISREEFRETFVEVYDSEVTLDYLIVEQFYPNGLYPSSLHNTIIMEFEGFTRLLSKWIIETIISNKQLNNQFKKLAPIEYQYLWPTSKEQAARLQPSIRESLKQFFQNWTLIEISTLWDREQIYYPTKGEKFYQFAHALESVPGDMQVIAIYPFYKPSLSIKFFFDSIVQIFQFVSLILYFFTMTLIMKQVYEEKEIEVGIWRTLGAGGLKPKKQSQQIQMQEHHIENQGSKYSYVHNFDTERTIRDKLLYFGQILVKVGFVFYWFLSALVSIAIYCILKQIIYWEIGSILGLSPVGQPITTPTILFALIFMFTEGLCLYHIISIYRNPLSQTIKPIKRTYDVVKVRIIYLSTFGISTQVLIIAIILVYYGVVSYYWIPYAIFDSNSQLQITLFNSIFIFMIFGAIILLSVLQSRIERLILRVLFKLNSNINTMKVIILKNIKAKQYKNIKVSIIIAVIFAFVLFFTAGIKIQIQIVESFIARALGSDLVMENYEKNTFNTSSVNAYLDTKPDLEYSWLSRNLNRKNIEFSFISHVYGDDVWGDFKVLTPKYLNSTFYEYYFPEEYLTDSGGYWQLPNGLPDGFNSIYTGVGGSESVGKFNPNDTLTQPDPHHVNIDMFREDDELIEDWFMDVEMAPQEQVIDVVVSADMRDELGVHVGNYYKMKVRNIDTYQSYYIRSRIVHSFKAGPGFDILPNFAFISSEQAEYLYSILEEKEMKVDENEKLFIKGQEQDLQGVGAAIITISPEHTQMFEMSFVAKSFQLLETYLNGFIIMITGIMSILAVLFLFLYTSNKCRQESEMFKMLRAIGLSAQAIRLMIFLEILIRLIVSISNGILLGIALSVGFGAQIEQFLMINTPPIDLTIVLVIAAILLVVFSITVLFSTHYLTKRTVAQTNKL